MSSCFFSSRLKILISRISVSRKRLRTALPKEPVPPVINKHFPLKSIFNFDFQDHARSTIFIKVPVSHGGLFPFEFSVGSMIFRYQVLHRLYHLARAERIKIVQQPIDLLHYHLTSISATWAFLIFS